MSAALGSGGETGVGVGAGSGAPPCGQRSAAADTIEAELRSFCRAGELVYAAVVDWRGGIEYSVCTVGSRPHNEAQIGVLVSQVFATARALGDEVGEREPQGLNLQGAQWSYSLDPMCAERLLFGIFSHLGLPAIVRACAQKTRAALHVVFEDGE